MIYMEPMSLGWRPIFKSWLNTLPLTFQEDHKRILTDMFERFVDPCLALVRKRCKVSVKTLCVICEFVQSVFRSEAVILLLAKQQYFSLHFSPS
jgi:hypothetical protein